MTKLALVILLGWMTAMACNAWDLELPKVGTIRLGTEWKLLEKNTNSIEGADYFIVLQNGTNEFLSFLVSNADYYRHTNAIFYSDSAIEAFPDGHYRWGSSRKENKVEMSLWSLHTEVVRMDRYEALSYSKVIERPGPDGNLMAHGYTLFGDRYVIVQHTSTRPITPELIGSVAYFVMEEIKKTSLPEHLRVFHQSGK